jgi:ElaB/YqjD/DUF883 family membrane-anchored ribosome-binding protein
MSAAAGEDQQKSPEAIQAEIDETRAELGDTVEALARKADVKAQAKEKITSIKDAAAQKTDELTSRAREATPESAGAGAQQLASTVQRKPLPFTAGTAFAAGLLIGWILRGR